MGISIDKAVRQQLIFLTIVIMLAAVFTSRVLLSSGFILFLIATCIHNNFIGQLRRFATSPLLIGMSLLFLIPFISWFWSEDQLMWERFARIKLPLLLFPIAFAGNWQLNKKQWHWIGYIFLLLVFAGCCWSLGQYAKNISGIHQQYLKAKVFATPLDNDHVRFSLIVCIAIISAGYLFKTDQRKTVRIILTIVAFFLIAYLHILSARTGLVSFYLCLLAGFFYLLFRLKKTKWVIALCLVLVLMPLLAWFAFPTFQNRIRYNLYDLSFIRENKYLPGANDGNRMMSLKAGWSILNHHPFGVGADVVNQSYAWYDRNLPQMPKEERLFPSSELLMYGGFAGWIGLLLFVVVMIIPLFERSKNYFFWVLINLVSAFSFLFDIGLEAQFGVFIYGFVVLWWWKMLELSITAEKTRQ
jgi:O-antigen ligase